jgi:hypothetical protein
MHIISECVECVVLVLTLSALLFAFSVVLLTIRSEFGSRNRTLREIQKGGPAFFSTASRY